MISESGAGLRAALCERWGTLASVDTSRMAGMMVIEPPREALTDVARWLLQERGFELGMLVAEREDTVHPALCYIFAGTESSGFLILLSRLDRESRFPSICRVVPAAEVYEREMERRLGIAFETSAPGEPSAHENGAFRMPIGPVYSGVAESGLYELETCGENVLRAEHRLAYKYRAIEELACGRSVDDALLLAERCNGRSAFAHGWAFARAVEAAAGVDVPERAQALRAFIAELERYRSHVATIREICESTGLAVAASQASILEEESLRLCGELTGHRYLFGVVAIGGLTRDFRDTACEKSVDRLYGIHTRLRSLGAALRFEGTFFDRLENVGMISAQGAKAFGLVGPLARASGAHTDLRACQPYEYYQRLTFSVAADSAGDGAARVRVLFRECAESLRLLRRIVTRLPRGPVSTNVPASGAAALGWVEAPRGAALHWVRCDGDGRVAHYQLATPSLRNWYGFPLAMERFSFQDFPITLATLGLSVAEYDR